MGRAGLEVSTEKVTQVQQNATLNSTTPATPEQERVQNQVQIVAASGRKKGKVTEPKTFVFAMKIPKKQHPATLCETQA